MSQQNLHSVSGQKHSLIPMMKISKDIIQEDAVVHLSQISEIDWLGDEDPGHVMVHICYSVSVA